MKYPTVKWLRVVGAVIISSLAVASAQDEEKKETEAPVNPLTKAEDLPDTIHVIESGQTLGHVSIEHFGNRFYADVLTEYNQIDPRKLKVGQKIKVPTLDRAMANSALNPVFKKEYKCLLEAREAYDLIQGELAAISTKNKGKKGVKLPAELSKSIKEISATISTAIEGFGDLQKEGVQGKPNSMINQLKSATRTLYSMRLGTFKSNGLDVAEVHQRLGKAMAYGIVWAREGFK